MNWALTTLLCIVLVELAFRLPFADAAAGAVRCSGKAVHVVRAGAVSDHWKEKALGAYAQATFLSSLKLAGLLIVLFGVGAVLVLAFEQGFNGFERFILSWRGIAFSAVFASLYAYARGSIVRGHLSPH